MVRFVYSRSHQRRRNSLRRIVVIFEAASRNFSKRNTVSKKGKDHIVAAVICRREAVKGTVVKIAGGWWPHRCRDLEHVNKEDLNRKHRALIVYDERKASSEFVVYRSVESVSVTEVKMALVVDGRG